MKGSSNTFKPIQREDEPIGRLMVPDTTDYAVDVLYRSVSDHVTPRAWGLATGENRTERTAHDKTSMTIEAPDATHAMIKKYLTALAKPIKLNPKATEEELKKKAVLTDEATETITIAYQIEQFPVSVSGIPIDRARTHRYEVVNGLLDRIRKHVTPDDWKNRSQMQIEVSEISGRLVFTHKPAGHVELAKKLAEWVK